MINFVHLANNFEFHRMILCQSKSPILWDQTHMSSHLRHCISHAQYSKVSSEASNHVIVIVIIHHAISVNFFYLDHGR